jgi:general secretion pathway protein H
MAVLSFVALLVLPMLPSGTTPARHAGYAIEIAALLKTDRTAAARSGNEVATEFDVPNRLITSVSSQRSIRLPNDLELEVLASELCVRGQGRFAIVFGADGRSCGAVIRIGKEAQDWRIRINWLTGFVDVVAPKPG